MSKSIRMTALSIAVAATFPALAETQTILPSVTVTANGIPTTDSDATYASEVHDRAAIEASGAISLYDYLSKHTGLNVLSGGNQNAPLLDMRGYGLEVGYQNLIVVVDGYRLSNIDQASPYLGGIPLASVESIEISKGSGSVLFGDGAMSGVIQIRTRARTGVSVSAMSGSRGAQALNGSAGIANELFDISFDASNTKQASLSNADVTGARDGSNNRSERANLTLKPVTGLKVFLGGSDAHVDTHYVAALTPAQFNANPNQNGGKTYTHQLYETTQWRAGAEYEFVPGLIGRYMHNEENKHSDFLVPNPFSADYKYSSDDVSLGYRSKRFDLTVGAQTFKGNRFSPQSGFSTENVTTKDNTAGYAQAVYRLGALSLSAGVREERVEYSYNPKGGTAIHGVHHLNAADIGANYRFTEQLSAFINVNKAYQAPDVDRFFNFGGTFNGLIDPAKSKTITIGLNHDTKVNRFRVSAFRSNLRNEIYYNPDYLFGTNTNIDKSHKYGLELNDRWQATDKLALSAIYTYTRAIIDNDIPSSGAFNGHELPGVPRHGVTLGLDYQPWVNGNLNVTQTWRDSAYAISDFANNPTLHKQSAYNSTSLALRQRWGKIEGFAGVDNLFNRKNGEWVYANYTALPVNVYPIDFQRTARIGIKADFF